MEPMPPALEVERDDAPWWGDLPGGPDDILANYMNMDMEVWMDMELYMGRDGWVVWSIGCCVVGGI